MRLRTAAKVSPCTPRRTQSPRRGLPGREPPRTSMP
jgi:hypothetical protein